MRKYFPLVIALAAAMAAGALLGQVAVFPLNDETLPILLHFRLPRVAFAAVNGAALALAGVLYQIALRNPMAEGFTTGAASSAALGGCLALALWGNSVLVSLSAMAFAAVGVCVICSIAARSSVAAMGAERVTVILAGIALSVVAGSGIGFLKYFFEDSLSAMVFWLMGGLHGATWTKTAWLLAVFLAALAFLLRRRDQLALMLLDDASARASGVDVRAMRGAIFVITTALVAVSVSFCGVIGFLGLMVPHAVRAMIGHNVTVQLIAAPLLGAVLLTLFDLVSRTVLPYGGELPVGIITSAAGGCFFFILLMRRGNGVWGS